MIKIENLYKRYPGHNDNKWVLENINLTIPTGVSVGLIGPNGAGKSTLLKMIGDLELPDKGKIIRTSKVSWPIGLSGGFQQTLTGRQNVKFVANIHGYKNVKEVMSFVEAFAEIGKSFDEPVRSYSNGMKSRLAFGLSLAFDFDVYLSDEATAVGDNKFKQKARAIFKERVGKASLIMVSHAEGILKEFCEAGILLNNGQAIWFDDINEALKAYKQS
ncbi:ABC transporter ATP-binding protein [Thiomicrorhabdus immobilis]|uniref:ABC transporter ATP-binding protein n=1 Tax=Thiomicrorhabdus immobilis TaxID=2791037 RepID=A0ABN6CUS4_9GAMM|nr:ABC transporter ATP-binding protein [Thiomicrorhabdus immobilis]BCN92737.1 ABC transporter ATP-binding protein [Thiomicrorhabdus immobilis]